jgi:Tfp pilus assembly PilM family ATPase
MEQYLARPLDDYLMDYQALGSNENETGRLYLVAAYRRSEVERLRGILESTGFPLVVLDVDAFAAVNAFEANYPEMQQGRTFLVKVDANGFTCVRAQNGMFHGCDTGPVDPGILDLNGQSKTDRLLDLVQELRIRLDAARDAWGEVDNVVLCGDLALDTEFRELLESNVPMPLLPLNAFKEVTFALGSEADGILPSAPQFAAALGLALRRGGDG